MRYLLFLPTVVSAPLTANLIMFAYLGHGFLPDSDDKMMAVRFFIMVVGFACVVAFYNFDEFFPNKK